MMDALPAMEYPHWLMIAGGRVGGAWIRRGLHLANKKRGRIAGTPKKARKIAEFSFVGASLSRHSRAAREGHHQG